ncbi:MAG: dihydrolipoamide acetyltransferase family protein [Alphaproteobacteria bacterium]
MAELEFRLSGAAGEYMESATVVEWLSKPGDAVRAGQPLAVVETAKAATELPSPADGTLLRVVAAPGSEVPLDGLLAVIATQGAVVATSPATPAAAAAPAPDPRHAPAEEPAAQAGGWTLATPIARRLAREGGLDLASLRGSGPGGRVQERDVRDALAARAPAPAKRERRDDLYRRGMARRMGASAAVPQFSVSLTVDGGAMGELVAARRAAGAPVSANDVVMKAVALALRDVPRFNARWEDGAAVALGRVNLGMAVATGHGLAVPVVADCDRLSLSGIASASFRLRRRAIGLRLGPADMARAGFTVSNLGLLGAEEFVALVNPPEVGILAVGAFVPTPVVRDGQVVVRDVARLTVSGDHRAVDGADAAALLVEIRRLLEDAPRLLAD